MPNTVYFEDLNKGLQSGSSEIVVDAQEMLMYNRKYDPWPVHIDDQAAKAAGYHGVIASSGFTYMSHNVYGTEQSPWALIAGLEWTARYPHPVYAGDTLRYTLEVEDKRASSKPGRGVINTLDLLTNQHGDIVMQARGVTLIATRPR